MTIKTKLPGMTTKPGILNLLRNIVFGSFYGFCAIFFSLALIVALFGGGSAGTNSGAPDTVAEADPGTPDTEAEAAEASDDESEADEPEAEPKTKDEPEVKDKSKAEPEAEPKNEPVAATDGGSDVESSAAATPVNTAASEADAEYDGAMSPELMQAVLESEMGLDVEVYDSNGLILVDYTSTATTEEQLAEDLGGIAGAYAAMVGDGYPTDGMVIYIFAVDGTDVGYTEVDAADAQAYMDGELTGEEFGLIVLSELTVY